MRVMYASGICCCRRASHRCLWSTQSNAFLKSTAAAQSGNCQQCDCSRNIAVVKRWSSVLKPRWKPAWSGLCCASNVASSRLQRRRDMSLYSIGMMAMGL
eukprot:8567116-Pyramimonas_sp.AAC.1